MSLDMELYIANVTMELFTEDSTRMKFNRQCATFYAALDQALWQLLDRRNSYIRIVSPLAFKVTGILNQNGAPVRPTAWKEKNTCTVETSLLNTKLEGDLLSVMYNYAPKSVTGLQITPGESAVNVEFKLVYPTTFFVSSKIDPTCNFMDNLEWGFKNLASTNGYYLDPETVKFSCELFDVIPFRLDEITITKKFKLFWVLFNNY
ncbi:unnamed protein product [Echinostoma caproni]|uniref:Uncharacterized protein n=1 Tax=Echinostoma caproni TaxID=27848 RepID=A0A3P8DDV6_9TREM|nr:unnamed protein product [Echinostoma caproni]